MTGCLDSMRLERGLASVLLGALLIVSATVGAVGCSDAGRERPSILLVTIDTLRADRLGCYGYFRDTSPALDDLARESLLFESALSVMGTTLPAHVSLMTSTGTTTHGVKGNYTQFDASSVRENEIVTLAEVLHESGYETAAFVSATPLKRHWGLAAGFDHFSQPESTEQTADRTTDLVLSWLDGKPRRPFFLWVHYFDPHYPYHPPLEYAQLFKSDERQIRALEELRIDLDQPRLLLLNNFYDGEVRYVDDQLGRLFAELKEDGIWDDAAIVVTSDHGEGLLQHHWLNHGQIYNEQLFVPLIMKLPRGSSRAGVRDARLASILDVVPTLVENLPIPIDDDLAMQFEGIDLLDQRADRDYLFAERTRALYGTEGELDWTKNRHYALTNLTWKYVLRTAEDDVLYDMGGDRVETVNRIADFPDVARELKARILEILSRDVENQRSTTGEVPPKLERELRSLGYLE